METGLLTASWRERSFRSVYEEKGKTLWRNAENGPGLVGEEKREMAIRKNCLPRPGLKDRYEVWCDPKFFFRILYN